MAAAVPCTPASLVRVVAARSCRAAAAAILAALAGMAPLRAEPVAPPEEELLEVSERGRAIALAFEAVLEGGDLFSAQARGVADPDGRIVLKGPDGLRVVFVKDVKEGTNKGLKVVAEAAFDPTAGQALGLKVMIPPQPAPSVTASYYRAVQQALLGAASHPAAPPPYETAVIREKNGTFSVYLKSAASNVGGAGGVSGPVAGADLLARVAASGRQLLTIEALHAEVTPLVEARAAGQPTLHTHTIGDLPTPTDVALVLRRPALAPHLVLTPLHMFRIDPRGTITWLGPNPVPPAKPAPSPAPAAGSAADPARAAPPGGGAS